jgi:hypothetical protein
MKNPKKIGNEYERKICSIIEEMLGVEFKRTKLSGGADHKGDIRDWTQSTPLSRYCQEIKYHGSQKSFNKEFKDNINQAIRQTPANKNWQLITHLPNTDIELVVMDFKDYLVNDILGQMTGNKEDLKKELIEIADLIYKLRKKFENLRGKL